MFVSWKANHVMYSRLRLHEAANQHANKTSVLFMQRSLQLQNWDHYFKTYLLSRFLVNHFMAGATFTLCQCYLKNAQASGWGVSCLSSFQTFLSFMDRGIGNDKALNRRRKIFSPLLDVVRSFSPSYLQQTRINKSSRNKPPRHFGPNLNSSAQHLWHFSWFS